jgi:16S rRNA (cytidine1402-2'-O)-methyltransferase
MSTLFLVATPIGNLEDITLRALRILKEAPLIAAEDTRTARVLLNHYGIKARVTSYNEHNAAVKTPAIIDALADGDVALVTDAGMPAISDPGHELVVAAVDAGHDVVPVAGASAVVAAVAASGLPSRRFHYLGFLPRQSGPRRRALVEAAASGDTLVVYESPRRVRAMLEDALAVLGNRRVAVARELTKLHEEIWRGSLSAAVEHFAEPRGEFTVVIEGGPLTAEDGPDVREAALLAAVAELRRTGASSQDAMRKLREGGFSRRDAYRAWHNI